VLDTVREGADDPEFCDARATWLTAALADRDAPALIVMHHPPFASGVTWMDPAQADWSEPIGRAIEAAPQVIGIVCGHVHRSIHRTWCGVPASTAPATAHQVALNLTTGAPPELSLEASGFQLHRWDGHDLVTYTASVEGFSKRFSSPLASGPGR
jgi:Icc protein